MLLRNITVFKRNPIIFFGLLFICVHQTEATTFYVNDDDRKGDIYTTAVGNDINNGTSSASPRLSIWATYEKALDGDTIIIDTGSYKDLTSKGELLFAVTKKITFVICGASDTIFSKTPLPANAKLNPSEIYLNKDKPIERETYLQELQNRKTRKPQ